MSRRAINLCVGDRVERLGTAYYSSPDRTGAKLEPGMIGHVVRVTPPYVGSGALLVSDADGDLYDEDADGYALVRWPEWKDTLVRVDGEGKSWRRS